MATLDLILGAVERRIPSPRGTVPVTIVLVATSPRGCCVAKIAASPSQSWTAENGAPLSFAEARALFGYIDAEHYRP
jgi:hypothetical protein